MDGEKLIVMVDTRHGTDTYVCCFSFVKVYILRNKLIFLPLDWLEYPLLSRVSTLTRDIDIAILSVCPSVRLSVTFRFPSKRLNVLS